MQVEMELRKADMPAGVLTILGEHRVEVASRDASWFNHDETFR